MSGVQAMKFSKALIPIGNSGEEREDRYDGGREETVASERRERATGYRSRVTSVAMDAIDASRHGRESNETCVACWARLPGDISNKMLIRPIADRRSMSARLLMTLLRSLCYS